MKSLEREISWARSGDVNGTEGLELRMGEEIIAWDMVRAGRTVRRA